MLLGALYQLTTSRKVVSNTRNKHKLFRLIHLAVYSSGCFDMEDPHSNTTCQHWNETHVISIYELFVFINMCDVCNQLAYTNMPECQSFRTPEKEHFS